MLLLIQGNTRSTLNDFLQIQQQIIFTFFFFNRWEQMQGMHLCGAARVSNWVCKCFLLESVSTTHGREQQIEQQYRT